MSLTKLQVPAMPAKTTLGQRLRLARQRHGLSQAELAASLGVTKLTVLHWEGGKSRPAAEHLARLTCVGIDPSLVAFGIPSLATAEARAAFATAIQDCKMTTDCQASVHPINLAVLEAAWDLFTTRTAAHASDSTSEPVRGEGVVVSSELNEKSQLSSSKSMT